MSIAMGLATRQTPEYRRRRSGSSRGRGSSDVDVAMQGYDGFVWGRLTCRDGSSLSGQMWAQL